jgi:alanine dehydrogenase
MIIGVPKEIKNNENRVALVPANIPAIAGAGHKVIVQKGAGLGSGFVDEEYTSHGAQIVERIEDVYAQADMIVKVKEPQPAEFALLKTGQIIFTYLHLAVEKELTEALLDKQVTGIAYETIQTADGQLPLLTPMSEVAGKMSVQIAAGMLEKHRGGAGVLMGGVAGVAPAKVMIIGGGIVGLNAAKIAIGMGAETSIFDININRLRELENIFAGKIKTFVSSEQALKEHIKNADAVIGAVLIPGAKAPHLVSEAMVKSMKKGAVIVDVAIDQGGIFETIDRITTHSDPTYEKYGVLHYSVANIPGAVARTSTMALTNATQPYLLKMLKEGVENSFKSTPALAKGVNTYKGKLTNKPVADAVNKPFIDLMSIL